MQISRNILHFCTFCIDVGVCIPAVAVDQSTKVDVGPLQQNAGVHVAHQPSMGLNVRDLVSISVSIQIGSLPVLKQRRRLMNYRELALRVNYTRDTKFARADLK